MVQQMAETQDEQIKYQRKRYPYCTHYSGLFHANWFVAFTKQTQIQGHHHHDKQHKAGYKYQFTGHYLFLSVVNRTNCSKLSLEGLGGKVFNILNASSWYNFI